MRKTILTRKQLRLEAKKKELLKRSEASQDVAEVRAINEQLTDIAADLQDIADELKAIAEEEGDGDGGNGGDGGDGGTGEGRSMPPVNVRSGVNGGILGAYAQNPTGTPTQTRDADYLNSIEYREAFAHYVRTGVWNYEQRDAAAGMIVTSDIGKIIPTTVFNEFIKELKSYGQLYNRVRKINVQGGVEIPIEDLIPTVSWITETTTSNNQSAPEFKNSVSFGYHIAEAKIGQSLLSSIVSLEVLESEIAKLLAEAFIKEFDRVIVAGTGKGQPLGILKDTRIPESHVVTFTEAEISDWKQWRKKLFAKIGVAYRGQGIMILTAPTWESQCMTLSDDAGNPVGRETFDIKNGVEVCNFNGKEAVLVESDILADFDTAESGEVFGIYFKPTDYAINNNLKMGFKRYYNEDDNKWISKGLTICDGKMLDVNGVFILKKA